MRTYDDLLREPLGRLTLPMGICPIDKSDPFEVDLYKSVCATVRREPWRAPEVWRAITDSDWIKPGCRVGGYSYASADAVIARMLCVDQFSGMMNADYSEPAARWVEEEMGKYGWVRHAIEGLTAREALA